VPKPAQGRIVLTDVLDPQSRNRKCRPVVIVTPTDEISEDEPFVGVAVTGTLPRPLPDDYVMLPYHNEGHPRTGLRKKSAAVCSWLVELQVDDIKQYKGVTPTKELEKILKILEKMR
jgi:mRNA-degrading endonuclease toxin of MazEF toxin-antitoxin module